MIGTSSERSALEQLNLLRRFQKQRAVPNVNTPQELAQILTNSGDYSENDVAAIISEIRDITGSADIGVSVKTILNCIGTAKQTPADRNDIFVREITKSVAERGY